MSAITIAFLGIGAWCALLAFWLVCAVWVEHRAALRRRRPAEYPRLRLVEGGR